MNLNHLAVFHSVVQEGGFSKGAARLRISQPAVSKQVRELEEQVGLVLIDRSGRRFGLTQAGVMLAAYAQRIFALREQASYALEELQGLRGGRLAVGASTTIGNYLLPRLFGLLRSRYPGIELELEIANTRHIQRHLLDHTLPLGLTEGLAEHPDLEAAVFMEDELVVIAPPRHPLAGRARVSARRLFSEPFIFREQGSGTRMVIERMLAAKGLEVRPAMTLGNTEAIKQAVAAGIGLGIVSRLSIGAETAARRLAVLRPAGVSFRRPLHVLRARGASLDPPVAAFMELLDSRIKAKWEK